MPHKRKPKFLRERTKEANLLVTNDESEKKSYEHDDRDNILPKMDNQSVVEVRTIIEDRWQTARDTTDKIAVKMANWEKQYNSEFQNELNDDDGIDTRIYLGKTREQVQIVSAYIQLLVSQLHPLVTFTPMVSYLAASNEEYEKAKVMEALLDYYFSDIWKIKEDLFPKWLKTFLKFSMAIWKVTYYEDDFLPDLKIEVVDRSMLYIDPIAHDIKDARWVIERYYLTKSEVMDRIEQGYWILPESGIVRVLGTDELPSNIMERYYGKNLNESFSIEEDNMVEVWDYWQAPIKGLDDVYAVVLGGEGGELVRYGRNPFPYKGLPYRAKSFDPHEYQPDGVGLVEQYRPVQEVVNNFLNMRIIDVRKNIIKPVAATGNFIDLQTQQDFKDGQKIVRLSEAVLEASRDPSFDLRKHFVELPFGTSTQELFTDLQFILGQGKETTNISDVFRGQNPQSGATLGQIQEQLGRNQGVFRPIYLQIMRSFEELAQICVEYFKSEEFFPMDRIIQIVGKNRYENVISNWHSIPNSNIAIRNVSPDEMGVDVTINAVNGADAIASRTFLITSLEQILHSIGQIPDLYKELQKELNFSKIVEMMLNSSGQDLDSIRLTDEQKQEIAQQQQQEQQQAMQQQQQIMMMQLQMKAKVDTETEQAKQQVTTQAKMIIDQNAAKIDAQKSAIDNELMIKQIETKIRLELQSDIAKMREEFRLEILNPNVAVGHGNNVNNNSG